MNMKQYTCPECGKSYQSSVPDTCPECGCPSSHFIVNEVIHNNSIPSNPIPSFNNTGATNRQPKIYYSDGICTIGDKLWEFNGIDSNDAKNIVIFPVHNISAIVLGQKYPKSIFGILIGILLVICGFVCFFLGYFFRGLGVIMIVVGFIIGVCAYIFSQRKVLKVLSTDSTSGVIFNNISSLEEAQKYILPMRQCLLEHKY